MANTTSSTNMLLPIPVVGVDPGPDYATDVNSCLTLLDQHNHTPGYGVAIPSSGLDISTDLTFQSNNAIAVRSVRFAAQASPLALPTDLGCVYESGVDLYYNDGNGNQVRITASGGVAGTPGSIANLTSPASATYVAADETFVWQSDVNKPANLDAGFIILRNNSANSKGLTLQPPLAMAANYSITLPTLPVTTKILTIDSAGNMAASYTIDGSTIINTSGVLSVNSTNLVDGITLQSISNVISVRHDYISLEFKLNGIYSNLTLPATGLDGFQFINYNAEIVNVWAYIGDPGSSGTTTMDIKVATAPGGSFTTIFTTPPSFTSAAASNAYVDANGVVAPGTGVTAPVLTSVNLTAGSALRLDLTSSQAGSPVACGIIIQIKQR